MAPKNLIERVSARLGLNPRRRRRGLCPAGRRRAGPDGLPGWSVIEDDEM